MWDVTWYCTDRTRVSKQETVLYAGKKRRLNKKPYKALCSLTKQTVEMVSFVSVQKHLIHLLLQYCHKKRSSISLKASQSLIFTVNNPLFFTSYDARIDHTGAESGGGLRRRRICGRRPQQRLLLCASLVQPTVAAAVVVLLLSLILLLLLLLLKVTASAASLWIKNINYFFALLW